VNPGADIGFYGKLPGLGDFVTRRLPRAFIEPWDAWLQRALEASRATLGEAWLDTYLTSPLWRFALDAGTCGELAWAGVLMPSVDRVGRYFPLTMATPLPTGGDLFGTLATGGAWFTAVEDLMLAALNAEALDIEQFDTDVRALPALAVVRAAECAGTLLADSWLFDLSQAPLGDGFAPLLGAVARASFPTCTLWHTTGSENVTPSLIVRPGLPAAAAFVTLLNGRTAAAPRTDYSALLADE
jgi:type VI secretion system protein ImpM